MGKKKGSNPWFVQFWDELNFDAVERLGVRFGELPASFALIWGWSVMRVEGTHCNAKATSKFYKMKKHERAKIENQRSDLSARLAVVNSGGEVQIAEPRNLSDYEKDLWRRHFGKG